MCHNAIAFSPRQGRGRLDVAVIVMLAVVSPPQVGIDAIASRQGIDVDCNFSIFRRVKRVGVHDHVVALVVVACREACTLDELVALLQVGRVDRHVEHIVGDAQVAVDNHLIDDFHRQVHQGLKFRIRLQLKIEPEHVARARSGIFGILPKQAGQGFRQHALYRRQQGG